MAEGLSRLGQAGGVEAIDDAGMVRAARTDAAAFAPLYRHYVTPVYRYVYSHVGNAADADKAGPDFPHDSSSTLGLGFGAG